ncbi:MAG: lipopolysaccharide biosynthesis protein [Bacteroidales bacterium]
MGKETGSLGLKSFKGVLWNVFGRVSNQAMGFAMGILLARMIAPESYGLIAMALVVVGMIGFLIDGGFSTALIRKKAPSESDYHTVFWFNMAVAVVLYVLIWLSAPALERFFETPALVPVIRWISLGLVIQGLVAIQRIQLTKRLAFKAMNLTSLVATFVSGVLGIGLALAGYGVWALVVQQLSSQLLSALLLILVNRWRPVWHFSRDSFRELFGFGSKLLLSGLLNSIFENLYPLIVGKLFSPAALAFYTRADSYQKLIARNLTSIVGSVSFPSLAPLQDDNARLKQAYRQMIRMVMLVNAPVLLGLMAVAQPLIVLMITDKWLPTVPYLQWLCLAGLLYPLHAINLNVINVKGRSDIFLKLEIAKKILVVLAIFAGLPWGVLGLVIGQVITSFLAYFLNAYFSLRLIGYTLKEQLADVLPFMLLAALMALGVWGIGMEDPGLKIADWGLGLQLLVQVSAGALFYLGAVWLLKLSALRQLVELLRRVVKG